MKKPVHSKISTSPVAQMRPDGGVKKYVHRKVTKVEAAMIERMRAAGVSKRQAARVMQMGEDTMEKYYGEEVASGTRSLVADIAENMATIALDPLHKQAVSAGKFLLSRLSPDVFSERTQVQALDKNGRPVDMAAGTVLDPYEMTEEQREVLRETLSGVLKQAVDDARDYRDAQVPEAEYVAIADGRDDAEFEETGDE